MPQPIRIAIVGLGKIARDQHLPAIADDSRFQLVATVSQSGGDAGVPGFASIEALIADGPPVDAVSICTPPAPRVAIAQTALKAGLDVFLEKPPATTLSAFDALCTLSQAKGRVLLASWHSRFAPMVAPAREWLAGRTVRRGRLSWREDVRKWHPGQDWLFQAGGMGVFDPGINGLSILTAIAPAPVSLVRAAFAVPEGAQTPIAATMTLAMGDAEIAGDLDFLETAGEHWEIEIETDRGTLLLRDGGAAMQVGGGAEERGAVREYPALYAHFADLLAARRSDSDPRPLQLVADAFMLAERRTVERFAF